MKKSLCEILLDYYPRNTEVEELYSTTIANCVFNCILSCTAIMFNIVTIHAIRRTSSLPKTLKTLLLSLAVSDVGVGLLGQPFYCLVLIKWSLQSNPDCTMFKAYYIVAYLFSAASFSGVLAVSVDRFLAIHLHLRYQELVTHKRVVAVVISIWMLCLILPFLMFSVPLDIYSLFNGIYGVIGLTFTSMIYIKLYLAVRRHKNQIQIMQTQQVAQADQVANFANLIKSAVGIFYVYLVFLLCYLPYLISLVVTEIKGSGIVLKRFSLFGFTLAYLNSSLNPVIYCWKMRHIRHAVINELRNMCRHRSHTSHETLEMTGDTRA